MDLQKHQAPTWGYAQGRPLLAQGWRVFTKFRAFLLWFAGFHLGANLALIA